MLKMKHLRVGIHSTSAVTVPYLINNHSTNYFRLKRTNIIENNSRHKLNRATLRSSDRELDSLSAWQTSQISSEEFIDKIFKSIL